MILELTNTWPATLPLPLVDYSGEPRNTTVTGQDAKTRILRRSRFERSYSNLSVGWEFTNAQFTAFKTFVLDTLNGGAAQFKIELRYPSNSVLTEWAVKISNGYEATYQDGLWSVNCVLDLVNPVSF